MVGGTDYELRVRLAGQSSYRDLIEPGPNWLVGPLSSKEMTSDYVYLVKV